MYLRITLTWRQVGRGRVVEGERQVGLKCGVHHGIVIGRLVLARRVVTVATVTRISFALAFALLARTATGRVSLVRVVVVVAGD